MLKQILLTALLTLGIANVSVWGGGYEVQKPVFPAVKGYMTLLGDFHQHTLFSDGQVWPTVRVEEAKREGLDVIAITDHIEYTPHSGDIPVKHGRSCQIAKEAGDREGILVVPGLEITRGTQRAVGEKAIRHINCLFLTDFDALVTPNLKDAVYAAADQGAFIFWNHPSWAQVDDKAVWYPEMDEFLQKGVLKGFEVVNGKKYPKVVIEWCQTNQVAMLGNSDIHPAVAYTASAGTSGEHRPMTLVFAKERTLEGVKEALFAGRTAVYAYFKEEGSQLIGNEEWLRPIFDQGVTFKPLSEPGQEWLNKPVEVVIENSLPLPVKLKRTKAQQIRVPETVNVPARGSVTVKVTPTASDYSVTFDVMNFQVTKDKKLSVTVK